ncbi:hypothetical protein ATCC90586_003056 [Pythium insidiosum]|nr:hypothetical protein ATCC90586_003056 [Pythium insidiosum]
MPSPIPSLHELLRASFVGPAAPPAAPKKRPASASAPTPALPSPLPRWVLESCETAGFRDPSTVADANDVLRVLCVDHEDLREAREREATRSAVGAVVTTRKAPKASASKPKPKADAASQLLQHCAQFVASAATPSVFSAEELAETIVQTVADARGQEDLAQAHLFGLVGVEGMELIAFVLQHASALTPSTLQTALALARASSSARPAPAAGSAFSIQTATELLQQKQQRKAARRAARGRAGDADDAEDGGDLAWLEAAGYDLEVLRLQRQLDAEDQRHESTSHLLREFGALAGGFDTTGAAGQLTSAGLLTLPEATQRTHFKGYEHVFIPAHAKKQLSKGERLVPIAQLEPFAQTAFDGVTHLNRLQSKLFDAAYNTNQNLLVCAPTGAGKTNVAMLTILQEIKSQLQQQGAGGSGVSAKALAQMKIIYVAPMKALAQEVVAKFGERLRALRLQVAELTGDMQLTKREIESTHVIVTTPEKWDVITRKSSTQQALLRQVKLLIIDEVHLLADERGPVIETIVARTLRRVESTQSMIRIVGLSATLPNYADVATFLRVYVPPGGDAAAQNAATNGGRGGLFFFDSTYRPVPLDQTFIGVTTNPSALRDAVNMSTHELSTVTLDAKDDGDRLARRGDDKAPSGGKLRQIQQVMNKLTLAHCLRQVRAQEQVMVFVHSRKETAATMRALIELAQLEDGGGDGDGQGSPLDAFQPPSEVVGALPASLLERLQKSRNKELRDLAAYGLGIHHAGMLRSDRNLAEELFARGYIRVLCCTATLAWGVNLPAHSVLIKGTQVYNADKGGLTQLSMLDVMQIFGRAGRPQFDTSGDAVLVTTQDQLPHYLRLLTTGIPMESALIKALPDHLNAEIVSGTVSNLDEACEWLSYTYLFVRMRKNPLAYGLSYDDVQQDPMLVDKRKRLLMDAAEKLQGCRMIKILREKPSALAGDGGKICFAVTAMGRVASHFYIQHTSIQTFNELLEPRQRHAASVGNGNDDADDNDDDMDWDQALLVLCSSNEFEQLKAREDEMVELEKLQKNFARFEVRGGGLDTYTGKTNVLLQALIGRARVSNFTLISDTNYVAQNASRVCRALFEICLRKHSARRAEKFLQLGNSIEQRLWWDQSLLLQLPNVPADVVALAEAQHLDLYGVLAGDVAPSNALPSKARKWISMLPFVAIDEAAGGVHVQPVGGNMVRLAFALRPLFPDWREAAFQGRTLSYWLWVEDAVSGFIYHSEYVVLHQSRFLAWKEGTTQLDMECFVPVFGGDQTYVVRLLSDRFVGVETFYEVECSPSAAATTSADATYTKLLRLHPQPLQSLANPVYEALYADRFAFLNPIQTQAFHQLYHQDGNVLLCAPTGSGKTLCAELAMLRVWNQVAAQREAAPSLVVYIAPLKALAREKVSEWKARFERHATLRKRVVEVTGDTLVNVEVVLRQADIVVTTPEKWDLLTRSATPGRRQGVAHALLARTALVVLDEVHLVGEAPRGAVVEALVTRLRRFAVAAASPIRLVALSTALANAQDVGAWLGISTPLTSPQAGQLQGQIFNFRASVRPVPMDVHVQGFPERHYVARMAAMNKPTYMAIRTHSPDKPVLVFVSSKAQTKLTALDLISCCVAQADGSKPFLRVDEAVLDAIVQSHGGVADATLQHTLAFGIGLHHAGLSRRDRELVETLFRDRLVQVVISTATLAWGVNLPAHLVVIKGTEFFAHGRYRSYPLSDLLQMIGRAGRPLLDDKGVACVLVEDAKKNMISRLLYEPLALESCLGDALENHVNAEVASGWVRSRADVLQFLSWSLLFQRVVKNPSFYHHQIGHAEGSHESYLERLVAQTVGALAKAQCVALVGKDELRPTFLGRIAAALYVDVRSVSRMLDAFRALPTAANETQAAEEEEQGDKWLVAMLRVLCESCVELSDATPLRHHEVQSGLMAQWCDGVRYSPLQHLFPHAKKKQAAMLETHGSEAKAFVLLQMHVLRQRLPSSDLTNDLRALLDQVPRLLSAAIDVAAHLQHHALVVAGIQLSQALVQRVWPTAPLPPGAGPAVTPRLEVTATKTRDASLRVLLRTASGQQVVANAVPSASRGVQKPKPFAFYVLLRHDADASKLLQLKHVAWKPEMSVVFHGLEHASGYRVDVLCDAVTGVHEQLTV